MNSLSVIKSRTSLHCVRPVMALCVPPWTAGLTFPALPGRCKICEVKARMANACLSFGQQNEGELRH